MSSLSAAYLDFLKVRDDTINARGLVETSPYRVLFWPVKVRLWLHALL